MKKYTLLLSMVLVGCSVSELQKKQEPQVLQQLQVPSLVPSPVLLQDKTAIRNTYKIIDDLVFRKNLILNEQQKVGLLRSLSILKAQHPLSTPANSYIYEVNRLATISRYGKLQKLNRTLVTLAYHSPDGDKIIGQIDINLDEISIAQVNTFANLKASEFLDIVRINMPLLNKKIISQPSDIRIINNNSDIQENNYLFATEVNNGIIIADSQNKLYSVNSVNTTNNENVLTTLIKLEEL